jgi:hypothetical protein
MKIRRRYQALLLLGAVLSTAAVWRLGRPRRYDVPDAAAFEAFLDGNHVRPVYERFCAFLEKRGVRSVVPPWHLWRQGDAWRRLGEPAFAVPPSEQWQRIVPTLALVRDEITRVIGPVEVVSGFRSPRYNRRASGASGSYHMAFVAVDLVVQDWWTPWGLRRRMERLWRERGEATDMGLGLYGGHRFHVDTHHCRRWGN